MPERRGRKHSYLLRKKFVMELEAWMASYDLSASSVAYLLDIDSSTVNYWLSGHWLPSRDNAIKLAYFSDGVMKTFQKLAKTEEASRRLYTGRWKKAG